MRLICTLMVMLCLAACGKQATAKDSAPSPEPTATRPTPTATPPVMPKIARENSSNGATEFLLHYIKVINFATVTGDVQELGALSSADCRGCKIIIDRMNDTYSNGGYFLANSWSVNEVNIQHFEDAAFFRIDLKVDAGELIEHSDAKKVSIRGRDEPLYVWAKFVDSAWILTHLAAELDQ